MEHWDRGASNCLSSGRVSARSMGSQSKSFQLEKLCTCSLFREGQAALLVIGCEWLGECSFSVKAWRDLSMQQQRLCPTYPSWGRFSWREIWVHISQPPQWLWHPRVQLTIHWVLNPEISVAVPMFQTFQFPIIKTQLSYILFLRFCVPFS